MNFSEIIKNFDLKDKVDSIKLFGGGHINLTYLIKTVRGEKFILQYLNHNVFPEPLKVMENILLVTTYLQKKFEEMGNDQLRHTLNLVKTFDGNFWFEDNNGNFWRVFHFIKNSYVNIDNGSVNQAYEAAKAYGQFQSLLYDLSPKTLFEVIPNFHNTVYRFNQFEDALAKDYVNRAILAKPEIEFVKKRQFMTTKLVDCIANGSMIERVTHNDTKLSNVLFDIKTGKSLCVIDLDTVMSGLPLYDFGDCVRSATRTGSEDSENLNSICMDISIFKGLTQGYLETAGNFLSTLEIENLVFASKLITLEIGIRFLADYLNDDIYFNTERKNQNLDRARVQFKMVQSMEEQEEEMEKIVDLTFVRN